MGSLVTVCISFAGGVVQAVTGFGAGVIIMLVLPGILPMSVAPAVSNAICAPLCWSIAFHYRRHTRRGLILLPAVFYILGSTAAIRLSTAVDLNGLKLAFGVILVLLGLYFMFFQSKLKVTGSLLSAVVCCTLSGVLSGFFGIGGPPLALYYLAVTQSKEEYLGTLNGLLALTTVYQFFLRIAVGILTWSAAPFLLTGAAGILLGRVVGTAIVDRIDAARMKKVIYCFLALAGVITILQCV